MSSRKKILFVIESLSGGGAEKVLATLLRHIDQKRFEVVLCTIVGTGKYIDEVKSYVHFRPVLTKPTTFIGKVWYSILYRLIYQLLPMWLVYYLFIPKGNDVEIAFCEGFVTKLMAASSNRRAKKIAWVHIDLKYNPWPQKLGIYGSIAEETASYSCYDRIVCVSKTVEESFKEVYGGADHITTIYNPIDVEDIRMRGSEFVEAYNNDVINIVTVGRLVSQKGYDILLRVVKRFHEEGFRFHLRILGEGEMKNLLKSYIIQQGLQDEVELLGFQSNPYPYIANSDLFVCSSRSEGYSLVIAESLVLGTPVISTYCSGPNELLEDGKYGMLVTNSEDGAYLYEGLKLLMTDGEQLMRIKRSAAERGSHFSLAKVINEIENLLD